MNKDGYKEVSEDLVQKSQNTFIRTIQITIIKL